MVCKSWRWGRKRARSGCALVQLNTAEMWNWGQLGGLLACAGSGGVGLQGVGDFREPESFCCRQMMRRDLQN